MGVENRAFLHSFSYVELTFNRREIFAKALLAVYRGNRVVELSEDINLPRDVEVLVVIAEHGSRICGTGGER